ncbi:MAG: AI-2E family transporter [Candidatus Dojkabacteria bacterium]
MNQKAKNLFTIITLLVIGLLALLVKDYLTPIVLAFITSLVLQPLYNYLYKKLLKNRPLALTITLVTFVIAVLIPLFLIGQIFISQAKTITSDAIEFVNNSEIVPDSIRLYNKYAKQLEFVGIQLDINQLRSATINALKNASSVALNKVADIGSASTRIISSMFIYFTLLSAFLTSGRRFRNLLFELSPFDKKVTKLYYDRISQMMKSMFTGVLPITFVQTMITLIVYWIIGVPYTGLWFILMMTTGFLPFGTGFISIPIVIILFALGMYWQAILLLLVYYIVVINIDNVLRAKMAEKAGKVHAALMMVALFGGVAQFGFMGIIYGPVIMMLAVTTLEVYREYYKPG